MFPSMYAAADRRHSSSRRTVSVACSSSIDFVAAWYNIDVPIGSEGPHGSETNSARERFQWLCKTEIVPLLEDRRMHHGRLVVRRNHPWPILVDILFTYWLVGLQENSPEALDGARRETRAMMFGELSRPRPLTPGMFTVAGFQHSSIRPRSSLK